jgi:hypothetical protein
MADAQPTPDATVMAPDAQFLAQAPHSMHLSRFVMAAFFCSNTNTLWGQTIVHIAQPLHTVLSNLSVTTFDK